MAGYDDFILYDGIQKDLENLETLKFGSEEWKRVSDSIDKRYNTVVNEARLGSEISEKDERLELEQARFVLEQSRHDFEQKRFEREADIREKEIEQRLELEKARWDLDWSRHDLEQKRFERDADIREKEIEQQDRKSKREFIGRIVGIAAGIGIVGAKLIYDNSEAITDKFTLDAGAKMISGK